MTAGGESVMGINNSMFEREKFLPTTAAPGSTRVKIFENFNSSKRYHFDFFIENV